MNNEILIAIGRNLTVRPNQILMFKADINYTHILMEDGTTVLSSQTLGLFERRLYNQSFFRPNRSVIINLHHIVDFQKDVSTIRMGNDESIIISRRRLKSFLRTSKARC